MDGLLIQQDMVFSRKPDKISFLYTEHTEETVSAVNRRKRLCPIRAIRVQKTANLVLEKTMFNKMTGGSLPNSRLREAQTRCRLRMSNEYNIPKSFFIQMQMTIQEQGI